MLKSIHPSKENILLHNLANDKSSFLERSFFSLEINSPLTSNVAKDRFFVGDLNRCCLSLVGLFAGGCAAFNPENEHPYFELTTITVPSEGIEGFYL